MRILLYLFFIVVCAVFGFLIAPVLGFFGVGAGWLGCALSLWVYDHLSGGDPSGFIEWLVRTKVHPFGG